MDTRYLIIVLGSYKKIESDLNYIANTEYGVHYVDGNGIFMGTFYSPYDVLELYELLTDIPAFLIFDISKSNSHVVNLPKKYFNGLFPEYDELLQSLMDKKNITKHGNITEPKTNEEYNNINDILDKLSRNNYDRNCLTDNELKILEKI